MTLKKWFVFAIALCTLLPMMANATVSRVIGMGGAGANFQLHDSYNNATWPQTVIDYPNQAGAEFYTVDGWDLQSGYVNRTMSDESVLKMRLDILNERDYGWGDMTSNPNPLSALDAVPGGYNKLMLTYARHMGDMDGGVSLHYAGKSTEHDDGTNDDKSSYSEIGLMLGLTAMEKKLEMSLGFETGSYSIDQGGETVYEGDGASTIMLTGRYWHTMKDDCTIIPFLQLVSHTDNFKGTDGSQDFTGEWSETAIKLGVGDNWTPAEDMLVICELGLLMDNAKAKDDRVSDGEEAKYTETGLTWRLGSEIMVWDWMDARFGAERTWDGQKTEMGDFVNAHGAPQTYTYLGASCHWNRLMFDTVVNPAFLAWGPNFVSGYNGQLLWRTSMTFKFKNS